MADGSVLVMFFRRGLDLTYDDKTMRCAIKELSLTFVDLFRDVCTHVVRNL
jgi:hypothetical protein